MDPIQLASRLDLIMPFKSPLDIGKMFGPHYMANSFIVLSCLPRLMAVEDNLQWQHINNELEFKSSCYF